MELAVICNKNGHIMNCCSDPYSIPWSIDCACLPSDSTERKQQGGVGSNEGM